MRVMLLTRFMKARVQTNPSNNQYRMLLGLSVNHFSTIPSGNQPQTDAKMLNISSHVLKLLNVYEDIKTQKSATTLDQVSPKEIFANNHIRMSSISVVGFDYDYTLCHYSDEIQSLIYAMARDYLIHKLRYPRELRHLKYDPTFAIRGLTIDAEKGLLCKMSSHQKLAYNGVFKGRRRLSRAEVLREYQGSRHITIGHRNDNMTPLNDLFSVAHACLFADIVQFFIDQNIPYEPTSVFEDIDGAIADVHVSGLMHTVVEKDLSKYIEPNPQLRPLLQRMKDSGKQLFLCTNSSFRYIDAGMTYMIGKNWNEFFDVISVNAGKPDFFVPQSTPYQRNRAFRLIDTVKGRVKWQPVTKLERGKVYTQGSLNELIALTGWKGSSVLYIGDSLFSDLVEPSRISGWRTGAIIRDLESELQIQSTPEYQQLVYQIQALEELLRRVQNLISTRSQEEAKKYPLDADVVEKLVDEHEELQLKIGQAINESFGSVFRVESFPSQFAFSIQRYVDIYSSRLENFLDYPENYTFYPQHTRLPHEPKNHYQVISNTYDRAITNIED